MSAHGAWLVLAALSALMVGWFAVFWRIVF
jgi:hypothetical protein